MQSIISSKDARIAVAFEKGYRTHELLGKIGNLSFSASAGSRKARVPNVIQRVHIRWIIFTRKLTCRPAVLGSDPTKVAKLVFQKNLEDFVGKLQLRSVAADSEAGRKQALLNIERAWRKLEPLIKEGGGGSAIMAEMKAVSEKRDDAQVVNEGLNYLFSREKTWFARQSSSCRILLGHIAESVKGDKQLYKTPVPDPTSPSGPSWNGPD